MHFIRSSQNSSLLRAERMSIYKAVEFTTLMNVAKTTECGVIDPRAAVLSS
jgi:hypothetical protein